MISIYTCVQSVHSVSLLFFQDPCDLKICPINSKCVRYSRLSTVPRNSEVFPDTTWPVCDDQNQEIEKFYGQQKTGERLLTKFHSSELRYIANISLFPYFLH